MSVHRYRHCSRLALLLLSIQLRKQSSVHAFPNNYYPSPTSSSSFASLATTTTTTYTTSCHNHHHNNPRIRNPLRRRHNLFSLSSSSSKEHLHQSKSSKRTRRQRWNDILNGSMLIAGTTVGGGFLALPTVVAPNGFIPSAITLIGVWAYFWMESLVLTECLILTRQITKLQQQQPDDGEEEENKKNEEKKDIRITENPGIPAAAREAFGSLGEKIVLILLVVLTEATLVSQIARAGTFFTPFYRVGCAIVAISMAGLVFGTSNKNVVTETNSILTILFCILAITLFGSGAPAADWSNLKQQFSSWTKIPQAIPTFLQLLVYGEILPTICQLLDYRFGPIRLAITIGSVLPLILEVGWAALGIGLLPVKSAVATRLGGGISTTSDPVDLLLAVGPVRLPLFALAITAITTTIIGSYLALKSAMDDIFPFLQHASKPNNNNNNNMDKYDAGMTSQARDVETQTTIPYNPRMKNRRRSIISTMWIVLPALGISSISPSLFLQAIDFAGSYPVILLWGIAPAAIDFRLRQKLNLRTKNSPTAFAVATAEYSLLPKWWLLLVSGISFTLFSMSAVPDLLSLMRRILKFL